MIYAHAMLHLFWPQELAAEYTALSEHHIEKLLDDQRMVHDMQTQALWEVTKVLIQVVGDI